MCNPRRVRVHATRELAEAWEQEVRRQVTRAGSVVGEARVREPLESSVGGPTLAALTMILEDADGWVEDADGVFWHELAGGRIGFDPDTRELEIVASVSAEVQATGEAVDVVRADVSGSLAAEGVGTYYDDNWGGVTAADARREAERAAARALEEAAEARREQARQAADAGADEQVRRRAAERAEAAYATAAAARREELRRQAAERLVAVGIEGRNLFHQALALAYRDAILAYAHSRRADNVRCDESGGVVEIEFDLQI